MRTVPGIALQAVDARQAAGAAWRGLAHVLFGSDPPPAGRSRSPGQRRAGRAAAGAATLLLCMGSLACLADGHFLSVNALSQIAERVPGTAQLHPPGLADGHPLPLPSQGAGVTGFQLGGWQIFRYPAGAHLAPPPLAWVPGGPLIMLVLVALAVVVPLPLALRHPLLGWRLGWLGLALVPPLDVNWWGGLPWGPVQILVLLVVLCAAGIRNGRPVLGWLWLLTLAPWWLWAVQDGPGVVAAALGSFAFAALAVAVDSVGSRRRAQLALADQAEQTELERARRAALEERARIARELHDVVAHHMSLVAIRAESAPHRLPGLPEPVRAEFGWLGGSAREALADMRRLLGVLRSDQPAARAPQPGLPDLPQLIDTARQAGMTVDLSAPAGLDRVPPGAGVCAYRIVQEALSNAGRHATGASVTVSVRHDAAAVTLKVTNGPGGAPRPRANGHAPGHGLAGMRERAELLGGSLSAGPAPGGGFAVSAVLPIAGSAA